MSAETPPGVRGKLFNAIHALCVTESERLITDVRSSFEYVSLESVPGAQYPIELRRVTFANYGLPARNIDKYIEHGTLSQLQVMSAFIIANDLGILLDRNVKRVHYKHPHCREVANFLFASVNHRHYICRQTPVTFSSYY